jgi:proteasome lid subunit RPN8/RPN11
LIEGRWAGETAEALALHPAANVASARDRFEIEPGAHFAALKAARTRGHDLIGCYHSHPQGRAEPSQADARGAEEEDFAWLISGSDALAAFVYRRGAFSAAGLARPG